MTSTSGPASQGASRRQWLVAHDFSPAAEAAAHAAAHDMASSREGGTVVLLHVFDVLPPPAGLEGAGLGVNLLQVERTVAEECTRRLEKVADELRHDLAGRDGAPVTVEVVVRQGPTADSVLAEARARGVERIVMGTHGRTGMSHLLLGSVAERVVRHAPLPVLVVKGEHVAQM